MNLPTVPPCHRASRPNWVRALGRLGLRWLGGWQVAGVFPDQKHLVVAAGPHTSNWDFFIGMSAMLALDIRVQWLAKHTIFKPPVAWLLYRLGGRPVDRTRPEGTAEEVARQMRSADALILAITPEGTRKKVPHLKTGFLRIARAVPCQVLPVTLDFESRVLRLHPAYYPQDDLEQGTADIRALFAGVRPRNPGNF